MERSPDIEPSIPEFTEPSVLNGKQESLRSDWWSETAERCVMGMKERLWRLTAGVVPRDETMTFDSGANPSSLPSLLEEDCAAEQMAKKYDDLAAEVKCGREAYGVILPKDSEEIQKWVLAAVDAYVSSIHESLCFVGPDGVVIAVGGMGEKAMAMTKMAAMTKKAGITTCVSPPVPTRRL